MPNPYLDDPGEAPTPQKNEPKHWSDPYKNPGRLRIGGGWAKSPQKWFNDAERYSQKVKKIERQPSDPREISRMAWGSNPYVKGRGFWEDPQNVIKYKQQSDAGIAPTWVSKNVVDSAYAYFSNRYQGTPKSSWTYLPDDDPASTILKAMPAPKHPDLIGIEEEFESELDPNPIITGDYASLGFFQKAQNLLLNKGTVAGMGAGAQRAGTWLNPALQAGMMGYATMSITKNPLAAAAVTSLVYATEVGRNILSKKEFKPLEFDPNVNPMKGSYVSMSDAQWNKLSIEEKKAIYEGVNDSLKETYEGKRGGYDWLMEQIGKIFDVGSRPLEKVVGLVSVAIEDEDLSVVMDYLSKEHGKELRQSLGLTYEVGAAGDVLSDITGWLDKKGTTKEGEVWQTYLGKDKPVVANFATGGGAIEDMRQRILMGEKAEDVMAEYEEKFGAEGIMNDFVYQSMFDPLNMAPVAGSGSISALGKITKDASLQKAGAEAGWNFKNKKTIGRMVADVIPGASIILPAVSGGKISPSTGVLGALGAYKSFLMTDFVDGKIAPSKLTRFQQVVSGLTREGKIKMFEPSRLELLNKKPSLIKNPIEYIKYITELTAVSKAFMYGYHAQDAIISLFEMGGYKINDMKKILTAAAQADGTLTQNQISALLDPMKEQGVLTDPRYYNSPIAASVHDGIKFFVEKYLDEFITMFDAVAKNRKTLGVLAEVFDTTPSKVIRLAKDKADFAARAKTIQDPARVELLNKLLQDNGVTDGDIDAFIRTELSPFTKKGAPDLYSEELFGRGLAQHFGNTMGEWIAGRYGVTHDATFNRLSGMLKSAQSILLLGWNPRYMINNELNNVITRIATGIWGYVPKIQAEIDAYGIDLNRMDVKANMKSQGSDIGTGQFQKGIGNRNVGASWDWIEKGTRFFRSAADKVGLFSKWSANIESMESTQSLFIPFRDMRERLFRPEIPGDIKAELSAIDPRLPSRVQAAVRSGRNMDEILHNLQGDFIIPEEFISNVAKQYAAAHHKSISADDLYTSLANRTGITDALKEKLGKLVNPTEADITRVFDEVEREFITHASKANKESLEAHLDDLRTRASRQSGTQDFTELGRIYEEMILQDQLDLFNHMFELDTAFQMKGVVDRAHFDDILKRVNDREAARYKEAAARNKASYEVLLDTLGIKLDNPYAKTIMDSFDQALKRNERFFADKEKAFKDYLQRVKGMDDIEGRAELEKTRLAVDEMYKNMQTEQAKLAQRVDKALFDSLGKDPAVKQWRKNVSSLRENLTKLVNDFRAEINDPVTGAKNSIERRAAWNSFFMEKYFPAFVQVGFADVDGAQKVFNNRNAVIDYFATRIEQNPAYGTVDMNALRTDGALDQILRSVYGDDFRTETPGLVDQNGVPIVPNRVVEEEGFSRDQFIQDIFEEAVRQLEDENFNRTPPNSVPQPTPQTPAGNETLFEHMLPMLDSIREETIRAYRDGGTKFSSLTPELQKKVNEWARGLHNDFVTSKYAALKYGQTMRDLSMLNYQQKTNFDEQLNLVMPYQFWFTHTMRNWLLRTVDKASWYNAYFRWREMQERLEKDGLPTRMNGKMAFPVPFLPDIMGDTVWFDPIAQLLPFAQLFQPIENFARKGANIEHGARTKIWDMVSAQQITREQAEEAINNMSGSIWEEAYAAASAEEDKDPLTLASLMMSPAMWWDIPIKLVTGKKDQIALTPGARMSQALQAQADETWGKGNVVGGVAGGLSWLETNLRKAVGMSPAVARFGQYGDYYIERELANMAFDGRASVYDAIEAMLNHSGELYDQAEQMVARQLSLRAPGMLTVEALRGNADALQTINSFFLSFFPLGLLPQGELKYKGIQMQFNDAWDWYKKTGDKSRVIDLYNQYPEMAARTALYEKDPEARMKQYIIGKIGDMYYNAPNANQAAIKTALGEDFVDAFVARDTMKPEMLSLDTLMTYARMLNVMYPSKPANLDLPNEPKAEEIELYSEETSRAYQQFVNVRDALFPFWWVEQQEYFDAKDSGKDIDPPTSLQRYFDWKEEYIKKHPEISPVIESGKSVERSRYAGVSIKDFDPVLVKQLTGYYVTGEEMSAGAWELLYETWVEKGKPQGDFHRWIEREIQPAITGVEPEEESGFYLLTSEQQEMYAAYAAERDKLFPNIKEARDLYFATEDKATRRSVVKQYPILEEYWAWDDEYEAEHPEIVGIKKVISSTYK